MFSLKAFNSVEVLILVNISYNESIITLKFTKDSYKRLLNLKSLVSDLLSINLFKKGHRISLLPLIPYFHVVHSINF